MKTRLRPGVERAALLLCLAARLARPDFADAGENIVITEFMAANARTAMDRDREFSDWIELHNAGNDPVSLAGWYLTDKSDRLTRWQFPEVTLAAGSYLVVFASGKDRRIGQELHTNFKLDADGGYLALVKPDGRTIVSDFSRGYPPQVPDVSYGLTVSDPTRVLVPRNAMTRVLVPAKDLEPRWTEPGFDDSSWTRGEAGVGFDSANEFAGMLGTNLRNAMLDHNASVLVRIPFEAEDTKFDELRLRMRHDDGFVAYLNGKEVARREAPPNLRWNSQAAAPPKAAPVVLLAENFESAQPDYAFFETAPKMRPRVNIGPAGVPKRFLRLVNGQADNQANSVDWKRALDSKTEPIILDFDFRFKRATDAPARLSLLLLPASAQSANRARVPLETYVARRHADLPNALAIELRPGHSKRTVCVHAGASNGEESGLVSSRIDLPGRQFHHAQVQLKPAANGVLLTVTLSPAGGGKQVAIQETLIPGLNLSTCHLQFAAQIGTWDNTVDLANVRAQTAEGAAARSEEFDLTNHRSLLRPGANVLAIHGLNRAPGDPAFLIAPELLGRRSAGQTKEPAYFAQPTPRAPNKPGFSKVAPAPILSRKGGVLTNALALELKAQSGSIRYTTDGSQPTINSLTYTAPIRVTGSVLIKARTFEEGAVPSPVVTASYTMLDESVLRFSSNLPLVVIDTHGRYLRHGSRALAYVTVFDGGKRTSFGSAVDFHGAGEMNIRGFSSANRQPKHSYTFRARNDSAGKLKESILGMPKHSDWVLFAPFSDKTLMRDVLAYDLSRAMGHYAVRARFVEVFLANRSGEVSYDRDYLGVYAFMEKIERGKDRVDVEKLTPSDNTEPNITGGYIFKRDHSDDETPDFYMGRSGMFLVEPNSREITREQRAWISRYMNGVERSIYGPNFRDSATGYARYLDVDAFIDQHWLIEMSKNIDGFRYSVFFSKDRGGKLQVQPVWDWNLSFGNANYHDGWDPTDWYTDRLRSSEICWFRRLSQDPDFMQRAIDRWGDLRRDVFSLPNIHRRIDSMAAQLNEAQARNFQRWRIMGRDVWPNRYVGKTYRDEVQWMKEWIAKRLQWIDGQFLSTPAVAAGERQSKATETLTLRSARGKIYYTLNGTDPRRPGGAVSPSAQVYKSPIPLASHPSIVARTHDSGGWSAPLVLKSSRRDNASD